VLIYVCILAHKQALSSGMQRTLEESCTLRAVASRDTLS